MKLKVLVEIISELRGMSVATKNAAANDRRIDGQPAVMINPEWLLEVSRVTGVMSARLKELLPDSDVAAEARETQ